MRMLLRAESFQRHHLGRADRRERIHAGACRLAIDMHGAGATFRQAAAEAGAVQVQMVAQHIEQGGIRVIDFDVMNFAIYS